MWESPHEPGWQNLPNPFAKISKQAMFTSTAGKDTNLSLPIIGRVSGRRTDIAQMIMNEQSAIFLVGAPSIGKSTLIRYLQQPPNVEWSWRNELTDLRDQLQLSNIYFEQIDLASLEGIEDRSELLASFIRECRKALYRAYQPSEQPSFAPSDLKGLRGLLRTLSRETPGARYLVMLDSVERLGVPGMPPFSLGTTKAETAQERVLALLDRCGAIRTLVDLIDEFPIFGVILSIESLPRPKIDDQFHHISLDLARFTTMTLQAFTWDDTAEFLAQEPENFGTNWAKMFKALGGSYIFTKSEQAWLRQQAGTHPYLLQQLCLHGFRFKQEYASIHKTWPELQERDKSQLIELINESLSTFLAHIWQRLHEGIEKSSEGTKSRFHEFIHSLAYKCADDEIDPTDWYELGPELRYMLYSEGLVRYDRLQPIHFPGSILCQYLTQEAKESKEGSKQPSSLLPTTGRNLTISHTGDQAVVVSLSELEYRLLKTLLQHPERCKDEELMRGAWGMLIERSRFTQRMHQLRKKLKDQGIVAEIIENSYGGFYSIKHPEWVQLD
jgi:Transcriptional regulatory protein, C terminal